MGKKYGSNHSTHDACGSSWTSHTVVLSGGKPVWRCPSIGIQGLRADKIILDETSDFSETG